MKLTGTGRQADRQMDGQTCVLGGCASKKNESGVDGATFLSARYCDNRRVRKMKSPDLVIKSIKCNRFPPSPYCLKFTILAAKAA